MPTLLIADDHPLFREALRGVVTRVVPDAVLREADTAIAAEAFVTLSAHESRHFLAALDEPFRPNDRLRQAMEDAARLAD